MRANTSAAGVPSSSAAVVAAAASWLESTNASTKVGSLTTCQYQRSVNPCGGNLRYSVVVNEMAMTTTSGKRQIEDDDPAHAGDEQAAQSIG